MVQRNPNRFACHSRKIGAGPNWFGNLIDCWSKRGKLSRMALVVAATALAMTSCRLSLMEKSGSSKLKRRHLVEIRHSLLRAVSWRYRKVRKISFTFTGYLNSGRRLDFLIFTARLNNIAYLILSRSGLVSASQTGF